MAIIIAMLAITIAICGHNLLPLPFAIIAIYYLPFMAIIIAVMTIYHCHYGKYSLIIARVAIIIAIMAIIIAMIMASMAIVIASMAIIIAIVAISIAIIIAIIASYYCQYGH